MRISKAASVDMTGLCHHIAIFTNNPKRLLSFYTRVMGFIRLKESVAEMPIMKRIFGISAVCRLFKLQKADMMLEIICAEDKDLKPGQRDQTGYSHWAYCVRDKSRFSKRLKKKGVHVITVMRGEYPIYFIKDPDGNLIEIQQN